MSVETVFVVLSDLHFGNDLGQGPEMQLLDIPVTFGALGSENLTRFVEAQCRGHYEPCVDMLPWYLQSQLSKLRHEGYEGSTFDLFILLGDQSTLTHERSYKFLREYLTQKKYKTQRGHTEEKCDGLNIAPSSLLAIPGNHDKLLRKNLDLYNREFGAELGLQESVDPQGCTISVRKFADREFVFILLDCSAYCKEELKLDWTFRQHLARGKVSETLVEDICRKLTLLREKGTIDGQAKLSRPFSEAMKVMLVHYAVDQKQFRSIKGLDEWVIPHQCEGLDNLVSKIKTEFGLSLVLHGHLHYPLLYNFEGVQVVSCSTTTRVDRGGKTGFFFVKTFDSGEVRAEHHIWNGAVYAIDPDTALSRPIGYLPRQPAAA